MLFIPGLIKIKKPLDIDKSLQLKNEMSYLEHRLILAFFESGLAYNVKGVAPYYNELDPFPPVTPKIATGKRPQAKQTGHQSKSFKVNTYYFESSSQYEKYRKTLDENSKKQFLSMPVLRKKLAANPADDLSLEIRYLTNDEINDCIANNLFTRP